MKPTPMKPPRPRSALFPAPSFPLCFLLFCLAAPLARGDYRPAATIAPTQAQIGQGIALFVPTGYDPAKTPSFAFAAPPKETGPVPTDWKLVPEFTLRGDKASATLAVPAGSSLYGTGEVTGPLRRNGRSITLWNTDNFAYGKAGGRRLYQSHPWVLGVRPDGTAFGVLFDTTWKARIANEPRTTASNSVQRGRAVPRHRHRPGIAAGGRARVGRFDGQDAAAAPKWALGFHQCRYSYYPDAKRARGRRRASGSGKMPCDVIWMDIHYMDGYRIFTFDPQPLSPTRHRPTIICTVTAFHLGLDD